MRDRLPPLFALQAFEAASRLGSFSRAAQELHLTPGAVSRQIRQLEAWCGITLFERKGPRVTLTREGAGLLERLGAPLSALHEAVYPPNGEARLTLQVATLASTAKAWLVEGLASFCADNPDIRVLLQTDYALVRPPPRVAMALLRYGQAPEEGFHRDILFEDRLVAVAAPALARTLGRDPRGWTGSAVLHHVPADIRPWAVAAGLGTDFTAEGAAFNDADVLLGAAELGMGVAICRLSLALPRLDRGTLVTACDATAPTAQRNLLIVREECLSLPAVSRFREWLLPVASRIRQRIVEFDPSGQPRAKPVRRPRTGK